MTTFGPLRVHGDELLNGERRVLELIASGAPLAVTLDALCRTIDKASGHVSGVYLLEDDGKRLALAAGPQIAQVWRETTRTFAATSSMSACGAAVHQRQSVIVPDLEASPLFTAWRDAARTASIAAACSTPFFSKDGRVLGTFAVFSGERGEPTPNQLVLIGRATHLASVAVERHRTDQALRESELRFSTAFYASPVCMSITRAVDGRLQYVNDTFVRMFGHSRDEAIGRTAVDLHLYVDPSDQTRLSRLLDAAACHDVELQARTKAGVVLNLIVSTERLSILGDQCILQIAIDVSERRRAEEALRQSDERFRQIAENIREVFWMSNVDLSQILYVSPGYERIWGASCESLYQNPRSWQNAIHPEDRAHVTAAMERDRATGFEFEYRIIRPDGSIRWIWDRGFPVRDRAGHAYRVAGIAEDITERKEIDEQLRRSEHLLAEAQRLAHIGSWHWDLANGAVTWSAELYRIFGVEPNAFDAGREAMELLDPGDRDAVTATIERAIATRESFNVFYRIRRRDGDVRILQTRGFIVSGPGNEPLAIFGTTQDMTERRQAEEALRRGEHLLRLVLDSIPVGVTVMNPSGTIILNNPGATRIWARTIASGPERYAMTKAWWHDSGRRVEPEEWPSVRAWLHGETSIDDVIDIEAFDSTRKTIQASAVPIRDDEQSIAGAVVVIEDITDRIAAARALEESVRQMQLLATRLLDAQDDERRRIARMLHETTAQDLAALKMLFGRFNRSLSDLSEEDRRLLAEGMALADRSMTTVRTLSYLLHPPLLDEAGLLSALRWYVEGFARRSGIAVDLDVPTELSRFSQEVETTLFRVVQEALINIHRHSGSPTARIRLNYDAVWLTLEVQDWGRGISATMVAGLKAGDGALGVGIAAMRERLKQIGGRLDIESAGNGAIVRAVIPLTVERRP